VRQMLVVVFLLLAMAAPVRAEPLATVVRSGAEGCHAVALTFDLCPVRKPPGFDQELVTLLETQRVPTTFFASGRWIDAHDAAVRQLLDVPYFELGTHGERHRHLPALDSAAQRAEILGPVELLRTRYGAHPTLFRAPYGEFDDHTRAIVADVGLRLVQWSVVSGDPDPHLATAAMLRNLRENVQDGSIIVFHANGKGLHTREVVETLLRDILPERGLKPRTVTQLLACHGGGS
jgi:peptidoglycan-N-acetylglucosamine deacetylase